jgi:hypothetical protein
MTPVRLPTLTEVSTVAVGVLGQGAWVLRRDRTVWCWGSAPGFGLNLAATPTAVDTRGDVREVLTAGVWLIYRRMDGSVEPSIGRHLYGDRIPPEWEIGLGDGEHLCAVLPDRTVRCWGYNDYGQLGTGDAVWPDRTTEPRDPGLDCVRSVARGNNSTCAVRTDGTLWCWGANDSEQAGVALADSETCPGTSTPRACVRRPRRVEGIDHVAQVFPGPGHTCAIRTDRTVWCWGQTVVRSGVTSPRPALSAWSRR